MKMKSSLLSGIATTAFAAAMTFGAQAQMGSAPARSQDAAAPATNGIMPSGVGGTTARKRTTHRRSHSMPTHDSTPAEKAATDQLNAQQLSAAQTPSSYTGSRWVPSNGQNQSSIGTASPAPGDQSSTTGGTLNGNANTGMSSAPNNSSVVPGSEPTMTAPQTGPQPVPNPNVPGNTPNQPSQTTPPPQ